MAPEKTKEGAKVMENRVESRRAAANGVRKVIDKTIFSLVSYEDGEGISQEKIKKQLDELYREGERDLS